MKGRSAQDVHAGPEGFLIERPLRVHDEDGSASDGGAGVRVRGFFEVIYDEAAFTWASGLGGCGRLGA